MYGRRNQAEYSTPLITKIETDGQGVACTTLLPNFLLHTWLRFRGTSAMRCCVGFFMGTVCSSFGGPAHPIYLV